MHHTIDMYVFFLALPLVYKPLMLRLLKKRERDVKKVHAY